jgi:hypothetical protein
VAVPHRAVPRKAAEIRPANLALSGMFQIASLLRPTCEEKGDSKRFCSFANFRLQILVQAT